MLTEMDDGTAVLLHLDTRYYYNLNPSAVGVWKALQAGASVATVVADLCTEFEVGPEVAKRDVETLLDELTRAGLVAVTRSPEPTSST